MHNSLAALCLIGLTYAFTLNVVGILIETASKKLQNLRNVRVVSWPLDHGHERPYTLGRLYKHVSPINEDCSSESH